MNVDLDELSIEERYAALKEISRSARFAVFRARRVGRGDVVVIKQAISVSPELRSAERLRHEYEILRTLGVSAASKPLDFITLKNRPSLVVEDAGARNLAEILNHRPLAIDRFLTLAIGIALAVDAIHQRSVIHRDICPENIVVDEVDARITLVDFEAATVVPAFAELPGVPGALEGTLAYMAPEQSGRTKRLVDRRADLYALGATFYEMLTGQVPFPTTDPLELLQAHAARAPYPPAIINAAIPTVVSDIVLKLLAKMPEWRYQAAAALAADLVEARRQFREHDEIAQFVLGRAEVRMASCSAPRSSTVETTRVVCLPMQSNASAPVERKSCSSPGRPESASQRSSADRASWH